MEGIWLDVNKLLDIIELPECMPLLEDPNELVGI